MSYLLPKRCSELAIIDSDLETPEKYDGNAVKKLEKIFKIFLNKK